MKKIIFATENEVAAVFSISKNVGVDYGNTKEFFLERANQGRLLVSYFNEEIVGFSVFTFIWGTTPFLELIKIKPEYQKQEFGSELMAFLEQHLREIGFDSIKSSTQSKNVIGKSFHKKNLFDQVGSFDLEIGEELVYNKLILNTEERTK